MILDMFVDAYLLQTSGVQADTTAGQTTTELEQLKNVISGKASTTRKVSYGLLMGTTNSTCDCLEFPYTHLVT